MADVTLEVFGAQMERLLRELAQVRGELADLRAAQADISKGQTTLAQGLLHIKRDGVIKDILARIDGQVRKLEEEKGRAGDGAWGTAARACRWWSVAGDDELSDEKRRLSKAFAAIEQREEPAVEHEYRRRNSAAFVIMAAAAVTFVTLFNFPATYRASLGYAPRISAAK